MLHPSLGSYALRVVCRDVDTIRRIRDLLSTIHVVIVGRAPFDQGRHCGRHIRVVGARSRGTVEAYLPTTWTNTSDPDLQFRWHAVFTGRAREIGLDGIRIIF